jgi:hypothetical protein
MFSSLSPWRSKRSGDRRRHQQAQRISQQRRVLFESLENRALLAADIPTIISTNPVLPQTVSAMSSLDITFSEDVAGAQSVANYTLIGSNNDGAFGDGDDNVITINSVTNSNPTVTLNFNALAPDTYRLTLDASAVTDVDGDGLQLDGDANGTAGGNYVVQFTVAADANDAPTVTFGVPNFTAIEQTALNLQGTGIVIGDVDADTGDLVATLSTSAGGTLSANAGTSGVTVGGTGTSTLTLTGTVAELGAFLSGSAGGSLTYNFGADVTAASDTLTVSVDDQGNTGGAAQVGSDSITVNLTAVNDAPTVNITVPSYSATEQVALNLHGTGIVVADADAGTSDIQVIVAAAGGGTINAAAGGTGVEVSNSGTGAVTLKGTVAEINALLNGSANASLTYIVNSDAISASNSITVTVDDLGSVGTGGSLTAQDTVNVNVAAINDPPHVTIALPNYNVAAGATLNLQNTGIVIADADAGTNEMQATVAVSVGTLSVTPGNTGVSVTNNNSGSVTLTGTLAEINALLSGNASAKLVFNPGITVATSANLTVAVNDQGNTGTGGALTDSASATINLNAQVGPSLETVIGFNPITGQWQGTTLPGLGTGETKILAQWATAAQAGWQNGLTGDFNGDGVVDVAARTSTGAWWVGASQANGFSTEFWGGFAGDQPWASIQVGDVNQDGLDDIIGYLPQAGQWWVAVSDGSSFTNHVLAQFSTDVTWSDFLVADFTGDGRADVAARTNFGEWWMGDTNATVGVQSQLDKLTTWSTSVTWRDVAAADFDGDGMVDIVGRADFAGLDGSEWWLANLRLNAPNDYVADNSKVGVWYEPAGWTVVVADTDGDGSDEILGRTDVGEWWQVSDQLAGSTVRLGAWANANWQTTVVGDVDGDGQDDLIGRQSTGAWLVSRFPNGAGSQVDTTPATWAANVDWLFSDFGLDDDLLF